MVPQLVRCYSSWFINLMMSLVGLASLMLVTWGFDYFEPLRLQIFMSIVLVASSLLISIAIGNKFSAPLLVFMLLSMSFLAIAFGNRYDSPVWVLNAGSFAVSLPWLWLCWKLAEKSPLILVGMLPTIGASLAYLAILLVLPDGTLEIFLIPLPAISFGGVIWAFLASRSLVCTQRSKHCPLMGAAMETVTMLFLLTPLTVLAILIADALTRGPVGVTVAGIVVGFLFSNAVATPFGRFLRTLGGFGESR